MKMKTLLTIVIPTRNRPQYLKRLLKYFIKESFNLSIIIADSSDDNYKEEVRKIVVDCKDKNFILQNYDSSISFYSKVSKALHIVSTPLTTLCADDDFMIYDTVKKSCEFLLQNKEYSAARGLLYNFYSLPTENFYWLPVHHMQSIEGDTSLDRIKSMNLSNSCSFYAIHRTAVLQNNYKIVSQSKKDWDWLSIQFIESATLIAGKFKVFNLPYHFQEKSGDTVGAKLSLLNEEKIFTQNFQKDRAWLFLEISSLLNQSSTIDYKIIYKEADDLVRRLINDMIDAHSVTIKDHNTIKESMWGVAIKDKIASKLNFLLFEKSLVDTYKKILEKNEQSFSSIKRSVIESNLYSLYDGGGMQWEQ